MPRKRNGKPACLACPVINSDAKRSSGLAITNVCYKIEKYILIKNKDLSFSTCPLSLIS